jgi:uncharacterized protein with von Willebrand factor type A (vWA) domain
VARPYHEEVRLRALTSVVDPDDDDNQQAIFEWYSREFHTPLHTVYELPLDDVFAAYYRAYYRQLRPDEQHNEAIWLLETPEERRARKDADARNEEDFMRKTQVAAGKKRKKTSKLSTKVDDMLNKMQARAEKMTAALDTDGVGERLAVPGERVLKDKPMQEVVVPDEQEVTVTYASTEDFEAELDKIPGPGKKR